MRDRNKREWGERKTLEKMIKENEERKSEERKWRWQIRKLLFSLKKEKKLENT